MIRLQFAHKYDDIISIENLLDAWEEFKIGKNSRKDVQIYQLHFMEYMLKLHSDLSNKIYKHSGYEAFTISDPKPRNIHKASVRDRVLHRSIYNSLYPFFDKIFISDSFSCRDNKGTQKALKRFTIFHRKVSKNNTKTCWVLKCDIRKFFACIDQGILFKILEKYITDKDIFWLLKEIIGSFSTTAPGKGLPLGNLTSQLFVNIYMNEFDQWMKHELKEKCYIRYADDFVLLSDSKVELEEKLRKVSKFLECKLKLQLHPDKVFIKTLASGVNFLGWVHFPYHRVLRTTTKKRMFRNLKLKQRKPETIQSYLGMLKHGNANKLEEIILGV
jgi:hypothetical protein